MRNRLSERHINLTTTVGDINGFNQLIGRRIQRSWRGRDLGMQVAEVLATDWRAIAPLRPFSNAVADMLCRYRRIRDVNIGSFPASSSITGVTVFTVIAFEDLHGIQQVGVEQPLGSTCRASIGSVIHHSGSLCGGSSVTNLALNRRRGENTGQCQSRYQTGHWGDVGKQMRIEAFDKLVDTDRDFTHLFGLVSGIILLHRRFLLPGHSRSVRRASHARRRQSRRQAECRCYEKSTRSCVTTAANKHIHEITRHLAESVTPRLVFQVG